MYVNTWPTSREVLDTSALSVFMPRRNAHRRAFFLSFSPFLVHATRNGNQGIQSATSMSMWEISIGARSSRIWPSPRVSFPDGVTPFLNRIWFMTPIRWSSTDGSHRRCLAISRARNCEIGKVWHIYRSEAKNVGISLLLEGNADYPMKIRVTKSKFSTFATRRDRSSLRYKSPYEIR